MFHDVKGFQRVANFVKTFWNLANIHSGQKMCCRIFVMIDIEIFVEDVQLSGKVGKYLVKFLVAKECTKLQLAPLPEAATEEAQDPFSHFLADFGNLRCKI